MGKKLTSAAFGACMFALSVSAEAGTLKVIWVEPGESFSWLQSTNPTPFSYSTNYGTSISVWDSTIPGETGDADITFFSSFQDGGFGFGKLTRTAGPKLYSGSEKTPVFASGSYTLFDPSTDADGTITFTAVPEPAVWGLMLVGFAGLGCVGFRKARMRAKSAL